MGAMPPVQDALDASTIAPTVRLAMRIWSIIHWQSGLPFAAPIAFWSSSISFDRDAGLSKDWILNRNHRETVETSCALSRSPDLGAGKRELTRAACAKRLCSLGGFFRGTRQPVLSLFLIMATRTQTEITIQVWALPLSPWPQPGSA